MEDILYCFSYFGLSWEIKFAYHLVYCRRYPHMKNKIPNIPLEWSFEKKKKNTSSLLSTYLKGSIHDSDFISGRGHLPPTLTNNISNRNHNLQPQPSFLVHGLQQPKPQPRFAGHGCSCCRSEYSDIFESISEFSNI